MKKIFLNFCKWALYTLSENKEPKGNYVPVNVSNIIIKKKRIIPNDVYIVNVGDVNKPYMNCSINSFREKNPDFKIHIMNFTYDEFFRHKYVYNILVEENYQSFEKLDQDQFRRVLNSFKIKILYNYGGIALDATTFTIRPFDDLLMYDKFVYSLSVDNYIYPDYSLIGSSKENPKNFDMVGPFINTCDKNYQSMKYAFYDGNLDISTIKIKNNKLQSHIYDFL